MEQKVGEDAKPGGLDGTRPQGKNWTVGVRAKEMPGAERVRTVLPRNAHGIAVAGGPSPGLAVPFAIRPFHAALDND